LHFKADVLSLSAPVQSDAPSHGREIPKSPGSVLLMQLVKQQIFNTIQHLMIIVKFSPELLHDKLHVINVIIPSNGRGVTVARPGAKHSRKNPVYRDGNNNQTDHQFNAGI